MRICNKHYKELEWQHIDTCFSHIRIRRAKDQHLLLYSLQLHGQLVPVIVVPKKEKAQWVLIDGYLRMKALQQLGKDTIGGPRRTPPFFPPTLIRPKIFESIYRHFSVANRMLNIFMPQIMLDTTSISSVIS